MIKVGRNHPCPCGSGSKFKRCHGRFSDTPEPMHTADRLELLQAKERIRQAQQGEGRPIVAMKAADHQMVAAGATLHWSRSWKTFTDFLADYIKRRLGSDWGNAEIAKALHERHPLMQWYETLCHQQVKDGAAAGVVRQSEVTGVIACYFGVAYGLYLLDHNVELQDRMIRRLKDAGQFQGAYYELWIASALIRAGFVLELEDETDGTNKHCEFSAVSNQTGTKYWIEAKMRGVAGLLGRTLADGTVSPNPLSHMIKHLNSALLKPTDNARMIFIDVNTAMPFGVSDDNRPPFVAAATRRLQRYEKDGLSTGTTAYVFVTNMNFHRDLEAPAQMAAFPFGLGMPDFNRPGFYRMSERYRQEKKHADALKVGTSLSNLLKFPSTFDGSLPHVALHGERPPLVIGEHYNFEGAGPDGADLYGIVADAIVDESGKKVMVAVNAEDGRAYMLAEPMTDGQLADYKAHPDAYFGKIVRPPNPVKTPYELFEFMMHANRALPRAELINRLRGGVSDAETLSDDELLAVYCEGLVAMSGMFTAADGAIQK